MWQPITLLLFTTTKNLKISWKLSIKIRNLSSKEKIFASFTSPITSNLIIKIQIISSLNKSSNIYTNSSENSSKIKASISINTEQGEIFSISSKLKAISQPSLPITSSTALKRRHYSRTHIILTAWLKLKERKGGLK